MWVDKYRPETFDEIAGNEDTIRQIKANVESGDMPHMGFFGNAGIGKTTTAEVIANYLYDGTDNSSFMELNASDERGIDIIRNKVKKFAGRKTLDGSFKIVFLDESDSLTPQAMQSLRRTMENYQDTCRFILTANYPENLIQALHSRLKVFEFDDVSKEASLEHLEYIAEEEDVDVSREFLEKLVEIHRGDLRTQVVEFESHVKSGELDPDSVEAGTEYVKLFKYLMEPNYMAAIRLADKQTLDRLHNYVMQKEGIPGRVKADIAILFSKYMSRMKKSQDQKIHMNGLVAELIKRLREHRQS